MSLLPKFPLGTQSEELPEDDVEIEPLISKMSKGQKTAIFGIVAFFVVYLAGVLGSMSIAARDTGSSLNAFRYPVWKIVAVALFTSNGLIALFFLALVIGGLAFFMTKSRRGSVMLKTTDERGVDYSAVGTYGTAEWMTYAQAKEAYEIASIDNAKGIILGQYSKDGSKCVCLPATMGANNNIALFGSPGTGKSYCYVRNAALQAIKRGESAVIPDPKGELYESTAPVFEKNGYKVKVFNLLTPTRSDAWDCAGEIFDPITGNIDEIRVAEFADILMKNTSEGDEDGFWGPGEQNLLKAAIFYRAYQHEKTLITIFASTANQKLYALADLSDEDEQKVREILEGKDTTLVDRERAFRFLAMKVFKDADKANEYVHVTKSQAESCDIAHIYYELISNDLQTFETKFSAIPISHPAAIAWSIFKNSSPNTQPGFVTGLAQKLQLFQMRDVRRITSNEDIVMSDISKEKTVIFVIISDKSAAMRAISSLFFNFLFKDLSEVADKYGPETRLPVNVICDEFANLGHMPQFEVVISTVRSRRINLSIILQSTTQLNKVYDEDDANTIIACCDTIVFIGCNDTETAKFISDLSGVASIRVTSYKDSESQFGARPLMQGHQISDGDGKRNLMNPDEVRRLPSDQLLIYHRGKNMLKVNRCGWTLHPYYKKYYAKGCPEPIEYVHLKDYELASEKYALYEQADAFLAGDVTTSSVQSKQALRRALGREGKVINEDDGDAYAGRRTNRNVRSNVKNGVPNYGGGKTESSPGSAEKSNTKHQSNVFGD
jgi:type IV secretory pathway TraG/TraD family ATPase VirD4